MATVEIDLDIYTQLIRDNATLVEQNDRMIKALTLISKDVKINGYSDAYEQLVRRIAVAAPFVIRPEEPTP